MRGDCQTDRSSDYLRSDDRIRTAPHRRACQTKNSIDATLLPNSLGKNPESGLTRSLNRHVQYLFVLGDTALRCGNPARQPHL